MNSNFARSLCVLAVATAAAISLTSFVAHAEPTDEQRRACTPDAFRLCSSHIPNVEAITACMHAKKSQLSAACKLVFGKPPTTVARRDNYNRDQP